MIPDSVISLLVCKGSLSWINEQALWHAQDGQSVVSDSVIFVRNPACNNYHGTSSGVSPSPPATLAPTPTASPPPTTSTSPATTPSPAASSSPVPTVVPTQPNNPLQVNPVTEEETPFSTWLSGSI